MSSPNVIRRYTPPTCTLEIAAKNSPLSRWMGQSVLKHLRFKLSFDDPRVGEDQWISVRGDRTQLQALCDAVSQYVQTFLSQSSRFAQQSSTAVAEPVTDFIPQSEQNSAGIHLQPKGLISHQLHLGTLASESSGATLQLSAVQLADLATALDEYAADVTALPTLERPSWVSSQPAWGAIAAALVVAVGVTASIARIMEPTPQTATVPASSEGASSNDQRLPVQPLPNTPAPNTIATLPTTPLPISPPPGTTSPSVESTAPTQPNQPPQLRVSQEPTVTAPAPQLDIPVRDVPVAAIPDQTKAPTTPPSEKNRSVPDSNAEPVPPATGDAQLARRSAAPSAASLQAQPAPITAGATIPQVAEAKAFFQSKWKPPEGMAGDVEYRLTIKPDGTIDRIEPLGEAATRFLAPEFPLSGEKFVSPVKGGGSPTIRLLLKPDGTVQTFLEAQ